LLITNAGENLIVESLVAFDNIPFFINIFEKSFPFFFNSLLNSKPINNPLPLISFTNGLFIPNKFFCNNYPISNEFSTIFSSTIAYTAANAHAIPNGFPPYVLP
jgi:hypothetical protein